MNKKTHIWKVKFDSEFTSSSAMAAYTIKHENQKALIATSEPSIPEVESEINRSLSMGRLLVKLHRATYLGELFNQ